MAELDLGEILKTDSKGDKSAKVTQFVVLGIGIAVVFGLSLYGWIETYHAKGHEIEWLDLLEESWETLGGKDYIVLSAEPDSTNWALKVAGHGAKILLVLGAAALFFQKSIRKFLFSRNSGHVVICGVGERGAAIARSLMNRGLKVALVEKDAENDSIAALRREAAYVINGNALNRSTLKEAGVAKATRLIAVTESDETNLAIAKEAGELGCPEIVAGVEEFELRFYFRDRMAQLIKGCQSSLVGFQCRAARRLMLDVALNAVRESALRQRGITLLIDATDSFRDEIIRAAALMLQISGDIKPRIHIANAKSKDKKDFEERFPAASLVVDLFWEEDGAEAAFSEKEGKSPDFAVFALKDDALTLEVAERFRMRHTTLPERVIACLRESRLYELTQSISNPDDQSKRHISIHNLYGLSLGDGDPLDDAINREAIELHEDYCRRALAMNPSWNDLPKDWIQLPDSLKDSNRLQASHHCVKREAWKNRGEQNEHELLVHLGRSEHLRWMAEKVMDGWRWSGSEDKASRDNDRLLHHLLIPYDVLSQPEKDKDLDPIKAALGLTS